VQRHRKTSARLGELLMRKLIGYLRQRGTRRLVATVLRENASMLKVFKKRYPNCQLRFNSGNEVIVHMDFADASSPSADAAGPAEAPPPAATA